MRQNFSHKDGHSGVGISKNQKQPNNDHKWENILKP